MKRYRVWINIEDGDDILRESGNYASSGFGGSFETLQRAEGIAKLLIKIGVDSSDEDSTQQSKV